MLWTTPTLQAYKLVLCSHLLGAGPRARDRARLLHSPRDPENQQSSPCRDRRSSPSVARCRESHPAFFKRPAAPQRPHLPLPTRQNPVPPPTPYPTELRHATFERCRGHAALLHLAPPQPLQEVRRSSVKHAKPSSPALCLCVTRIVLSPQTPVRADLGEFIAAGVPPVRLTSCAPS